MEENKMKLVNFKEVKVEYNFDGDSTIVDTTKWLGNLMYFKGTVFIEDLGFDDLARTIYNSKGPIEVSIQYIPIIKALVKAENEKPAMLKRAIFKLFEN